MHSYIIEKSQLSVITELFIFISTLILLISLYFLYETSVLFSIILIFFPFALETSSFCHSITIYLYIYIYSTNFTISFSPSQDHAFFGTVRTGGWIPPPPSISLKIGRLNTLYAHMLPLNFQF